MSRPPAKRMLLSLLLVVAWALVSCGSPASTGTRPTTSPVGSPPRPSPVPHVESTTPAQSRVSVDVLPWRLPEPVAREAAMATSAGVVVAGGLVAGDQSTGSTYRLDLTNGHVSRLPDLPVAVHDVGGAVVNGRPEVIGGGNATEQSVVQSAQAGGGWRLARRLPSARSDLVAATLGSRVFVVGGYDGATTALADVLVSTDGGVFRVFGRLRLPVRYAAVAVAGGALWVFGGERAGVEVDSVQRVDLRTGQVRIVAHLHSPLGHASAVRIGSRILLIGGRTSGTRLTASMWWFDPSTPGRMLRAGALPSPLADSAVVSAAHAVYLVGGETPDLSNEVLRVTLR